MEATSSGVSASASTRKTGCPPSSVTARMLRWQRLGETADPVARRAGAVLEVRLPTGGWCSRRVRSARGSRTPMPNANAARSSPGPVRRRDPTCKPQGVRPSRPTRSAPWLPIELWSPAGVNAQGFGMAARDRGARRRSSAHEHTSVGAWWPDSSLSGRGAIVVACIPSQRVCGSGRSPASCDCRSSTPPGRRPGRARPRRRYPRGQGEPPRAGWCSASKTRTPAGVGWRAGMGCTSRTAWTAGLT